MIFALVPAVAVLYLMYRLHARRLGILVAWPQSSEKESDLHLAIVRALARAIDAKDQTAQSHIGNVLTYATGLAKARGMSDDDVQALRMAAALHDVGKLAVPEHILSKPGSLTRDEFEKIRRHPKAGADILSAVPFPYPVAPIILSHHERWDGKGYPHGLQGEQIPLGARILAIADYFDAVTTERPYHKAMARDGAISIMRHEAGRAFDPRLVEKFIELLPGLTAQAATATTRRDVFDDIARSRRESRALHGVAESMGTSLGVRNTAAGITAKLDGLVPWTATALFLYDGRTDALRCWYTAGPDAVRLLGAAVRYGQGLVGWVAANGRTLVNADPRISFTTAAVDPDTELKSALVCPLFAGDTFVGALALYHRDLDRYTDDHRNLIEQVARPAGAAIRNALVFEQVQEESLTDPLTGLPNRRSMSLHLSRELARAGRLNGESAVIVMDVDDFKTINDTHGHSVGDEVLRAVAASLRSSLRPYDLCVRYAGDEFIIVIADCRREMVDAKCLELRQRVASVAFEVAPGCRLTLTSSAGAAVFPHDGRTYERLIQVADQRMYFDKQARRSRAFDGSLPVRAQDDVPPCEMPAGQPLPETPLSSTVQAIA
jgi:diguanylate cyclase (GGDEF)-like protein